MEADGDSPDSVNEFGEALTAHVGACCPDSAAGAALAAVAGAARPAAIMRPAAAAPSEALLNLDIMLFAPVSEVGEVPALCWWACGFVI